VNETSPSQKSYKRCLVEAAAWRAHLAEAGLESAPDLEAWLAADEQHRGAWQQLAVPCDLLSARATTPELLKLRRDALEFLHTESRARSQSSARKFLRVVQSRRAVLSIAASVLIAVAGLLYWALNAPAVYRTGYGERRLVTLSDGSQVELDSSSEVRVRYSRQGRELSLRSGQARFVVMRDDRRPFAVVAGGQKVVAIGTAFDVDLLDSTLYVTLIQGRVRVSSTQLDAGQQLVIPSRGEARVVPANTERVLAWRSGQMVFDDEPLASAIERVNRYSVDHLVLADSRVAALRVSGVFHTDNVHGFVDAVTSYLPVRAEKRRDGIVLSAQPAE